MTSRKPTHFQYSPLDRVKSEIRLVCLKPSLEKSAPILCELPLNKNSRYEALSYTWGTQTRTHSIVLDGSDFLVTVNLYLAVWTLRQERDEYLIWIDAICINQDDVEERSSEVLRMLQIYKQTSRVVVWLGEESADIPLAISHLQELSMQRKVSLEGIFKVWRALHFSLTSKPAPRPETIAALQGFFTRPWFRRVWIIQEIGAARDAVILCGRRKVSWAEVCDACKQIHTVISKSSSRSPYIDTYFQRADTIRRALDISNISLRRAKFKRSLLFLLDRFGHFEATNPRDKIYGLLGLAEYEVSGDDIVPLITPDYNKSIIDVYSEFARTMVLRTGRLDIWFFVAGVKRLPGLPSWAPDWTYTASRTRHWESLIKEKTYQIPIHQEAEIRFSADLKTLMVEGFIVAYVVDEGQVVVTTRQAWSETQNTGFMILNFVIRYFWRPFGGLVYKTGVLHVFGRLLTKILLRLKPEKNSIFAFFLESLADDTQNSNEESLEDNSGDADHVDIGLSSIENIFGASVDRDREETELRQVDLVPAHDGIPSLAVSVCDTFANGIKRADLFCMVVGASRPVILRIQTDGYELIGTANDNTIHPFVWRNCIKLWEEGSMELEEFSLQ